MSKENWLDALSDDVRDIRNLTLAVQQETAQLKIQNRLLVEDVKESKRSSDAAVRKADAAWEVVVMTREEIKRDTAYLKKPIWKRWIGID